MSHLFKALQCLCYAFFLIDEPAHRPVYSSLDGEFGAMMLVNIANDGPVTLELDSRKFEYIPVTNQSSPAIAKALKQAKTASASTSARSSVTSLSSDVSSAIKNGEALGEGKAVSGKNSDKEHRS